MPDGGVDERVRREDEPDEQDVRGGLAARELDVDQPAPEHRYRDQRREEHVADDAGREDGNPEDGQDVGGRADQGHDDPRHHVARPVADRRRLTVADGVPDVHQADDRRRVGHDEERGERGAHDERVAVGLELHAGDGEAEERHHTEGRHGGVRGGHDQLGRSQTGEGVGEVEEEDGGEREVHEDELVPEVGVCQAHARAHHIEQTAPHGHAQQEQDEGTATLGVPLPSPREERQDQVRAQSDERQEQIDRHES